MGIEIIKLKTTQVGINLYEKDSESSFKIRLLPSISNEYDDPSSNEINEETTLPSIGRL